MSQSTKAGNGYQEVRGDLVEHLREVFTPMGAEIAVAHGEVTLNISADKIVEVATQLRDGSQLEFVSIIDVCGVDYPDRDKRFDVVYHFLSPRQNARVRVRLETDEDTPVQSITSVFPGANWFEREAYDMYGILFSGHPDLRRLLTDYGFEGHPLRKEFPLTGHVQVRYDEELKRVVYEPVNLKQEFREFEFDQEWQLPHYDLPNEDHGADKKS